MNGLKGRSLEEAIELYKTVGYRNVDFLFRWISDIYDFFYLPLIDLDYRDVKGTVSNMPLEKKLEGMEIESKKITAHLDVGRRMQGTARVQDPKSQS